MSTNVEKLINDNISDFANACSFEECNRKYFYIKGLISCAYFGFDGITSGEYNDLNILLHDAFSSAYARLSRGGEELIDN